MYFKSFVVTVFFILLQLEWRLTPSLECGDVILSLIFWRRLFAFCFLSKVSSSTISRIFDVKLSSKVLVDEFFDDFCFRLSFDPSLRLRNKLSCVIFENKLINSLTESNTTTENNRYYFTFFSNQFSTIFIVIFSPSRPD
jgi:hypothetical protein